ALPIWAESCVTRAVARCTAGKQSSSAERGDGADETTSTRAPGEQKRPEQRRRGPLLRADVYPIRVGLASSFCLLCVAHAVSLDQLSGATASKPRSFPQCAGSRCSRGAWKLGRHMPPARGERAADA